MHGTQYSCKVVTRPRGIAQHPDRTVRRPGYAGNNIIPCRDVVKHVWRRLREAVKAGVDIALTGLSLDAVRDLILIRQCQNARKRGSTGGCSADSARDSSVDDAIALGYPRSQGQ